MLTKWSNYHFMLFEKADGPQCHLYKYHFASFIFFTFNIYIFINSD